MVAKQHSCIRFFPTFYSLVLLFVVVLLIEFSLVKWMSKEKNWGSLKLKGNKKESGYDLKNVKNARVPPALARPVNYDPSGPGEFGKEFILDNLTSEELKETTKLLATHSANIFISDRISLHRMLEDHRPEKCKNENEYDYKNLKSASVIIAFRNEALSTLLRTVYSVLHNTPDVLLSDIVLVNDYSSIVTNELLPKQFEGIQKVQLLNNAHRPGKSRARTYGLTRAKGKIVVFLDSHCECNPGWIEPLLESVSSDPTVIAVPHFYKIDHFTFEHYYNEKPQMGGFTWDMNYHERPVESFFPPHLPFHTPVLKGGFAANRKFLIRIGGFDTSLYAKGREDLEFSLRAWMCEGQIYVHPCARVGHVSPVLLPVEDKRWYLYWSALRIVNLHLEKPFKHVAELYLLKGTRKARYGKIVDERERKKRLECKNFDWYLKNVYPEKYVPLIRNGFVGNLQTNETGVGGLCVDCDRDLAGLADCWDWSDQVLEYNKHGLLRCNEEKCLTVDQKNMVRVVRCPDHSSAFIPENFRWEFQKSLGMLKFLPSQTCLEIKKQASYESTTYDLTMNPCRENNTSQQWKFTFKHRKFKLNG